MNTNSIRSLYAGYVPESERMITDNEEKRLRRAEIEAYDKLSEKLNQEERKLLEEYTERIYDSEEYRVERTYVSGFTLGARLVAEALLE